MDGAKVAYPEFRFAELNANGGDDRTITISFPGTNKTITAPERSWMRFDLVMNTTTGISDVYYNGEPVVTAYQATYKGGTMAQVENIQHVTSLYQAEFGINQLAPNGSNYLVNNTYLDNIICEGLSQYPAIEKFTAYDELDFSGYEGGIPEGFSMMLANDSCTTLNAVNGIYGKESDDISLHIKTDRFYEANLDSPARWQQVRYYNSAPEYMDNKSKYWRVSFNLAYSGAGMNRWIGLRYKMGNGGEQSAENETINIITLNGGDDGVTMTVGNQSVFVDEFKFNENKWMKFDIIVDASVLGHAYYDVYMNGDKLTSSPVEMVMPADNKSWYSLSKITNLMIGVNHLWSEAAREYPQANTYLDDISIRHYGAISEDMFETDASPRSLIMGEYDGFAELGASRATAEDTVYNGERCTLLKGNATAEDSDLYLNYGYAPTSGIFTETISFVATDTADSIYFATGGHTPLTEKIPMAEFLPGSWNTISVVVERATGRNDLYVNGMYRSSLISAVKSNTLRVIVVKAQDKTVNDISIYVDNYVFYAGRPDAPAVSSDVLTFEDAELKGYAGMTVGAVKECILTASAYYSVDITNNGAGVSDDVAATKGMQLNVWDGSIFMMRYTLGTEAFCFGEITGYSNGYVDDKFTEGEYRFELDAGSYGRSLDIMMAAAQYSADNGNLEQVQLQNCTLTGSQTLRLQIHIEKAEGTYLKFMLWNASTMTPYIDAKIVYPYYDDSVERVAKLYEGFTTRAFTMSYDDGCIEDVEMIRILNKYGAKATFNLVGSTLLKNYAAYGDTEDEIYAAIKEVYKDHEIANHTYNHLALFLNSGEVHIDSGGGRYEYVPLEEAVKEVTDTSALLKEKLGADVQGLAWSFKYPDNRNIAELEQIQQAAVQAGIKYERYHENASFDLPTDWMRWAPTCHHSETKRYTREFVNLKNEGDMKVYYVWGHSYEFRDNWAFLEELLQEVSASNIWMATNGEIYEYVTALDMVEINDAGVVNHSDKTVYLQINGKQVRLAPGGAYEPSDTITQKSIACWGDSLTWGQGASDETKAYPAVLGKLTGSKVYNMGVSGETAYTIAARQGAYDIVLGEDVVIPAQGSVEIKIETAQGGIVVPRSADAGGWNPCSINGIEGQLTCEINADAWPRTVKKAVFTRTTVGTEMQAKAGDAVIPYANSVKADINVIFIGTNGGWDMNNEVVAPYDAAARASLIQVIKNMIANTPDPETYIIVGLTTNSEDWTELSNECMAIFGEKYLDVKNKLATRRALELAGITPSDADLQAIAAGNVPPALLLSDDVHFNDDGYRLLANMIYGRMDKLGYLDN